MTGDDTVSPEQSRAARRLLNWSKVRLASRSNLSETTIGQFEESLRALSIDKLAAIRAALEPAGVIFVEENGDGAGVRLRKAEK